MESKKIIIPVHASVHPEQVSFARKLENVFVELGQKVAVLNLDAEKNPLYVQAYIENEKADLLVTVDCAGFELELLGDDLFYNSLCIPAMHFLTKPAGAFDRELRARMNFTMEFYVTDEREKAYIEEHYWRVPQVHCIPEQADWKMYLREELERIFMEKI